MSIKLVLAYALLMNIISLAYMYVDKQKAIKGQWRVRERKFFFMAFIGGSVGIMLAMKLFRHKTKHKIFKVGIPLIFLIQIVLMSYHYL